jgi:acetolactate synthase I/II/III large subunit
MNGSDRLCDVLLANDVDVCFANPGTSEMHFVAALDRKPRMRCILGLFEGVVTGAADGYARMAEKPAATLLQLGPGLANGLANLHNAQRADTPMINVVGDHATYHLQHDAPLTSDIESLARPMSHWVRRIADAESVGPDAAAAYQAAMSLPGIATLILPADAAWGEVSETPITRAAIPGPEPVAAEAVVAAAKAVRSGRRAALMLGLCGRMHWRSQAASPRPQGWGWPSRNSTDASSAASAACPSPGCPI